MTQEVISAIRPVDNGGDQYVGSVDGGSMYGGFNSAGFEMHGGDAQNRSLINIENEERGSPPNHIS